MARSYCTLIRVRCYQALKVSERAWHFISKNDKRNKATLLTVEDDQITLKMESFPVDSTELCPDEK